MILFHGSNIEIDKPDLSKCRPYKDFGQGFYLTEFEEQAERMADRVVRISGGRPIISRFEFNYDDIEKHNLKVLIFNEPDQEWAKFVIKNRDLDTPQPAHDYDLVIGPVADDNIVRLLRLYLEGVIDANQLKDGLIYSKTTSQLLFHTDKALKLLKKI